ncbi:uncharacterized protein PpBr36_06044 [Pyricularia pennisetigena]|uniref:uncharacterized protein n=1 Tax=Pyricularia pennisetigena TaxID=1578925 RepID=UPI0011509A4D|nr:uncharacterized protein PpBr36_06044 [Pyricularia pennisetigena]TLS22751.1 hypothetical protein PpBr36_06044 [Pyricularia pennisetigena]
MSDTIGQYQQPPSASTGTGVGTGVGIGSANTNKNKGPRACTTCARAKSRCIPGPTPDICERCHRLKKPCASQTPAPPRKRKETRSNRVADLERRLEELKTRLQPVVEAQQQQQQQQQHQGQHQEAQQQLNGRQQSSPPHSVQSPQSDIRRQSAAGLVGQFDMGHIFPTTSDPLQPPSFTTSSTFGPRPGAKPQSASASTASGNDDTNSENGAFPGAPRVSSEIDWPEGQRAANLVQLYCSQLAELFPFVVIPADLSHNKRPFLWKAVIMAASFTDGLEQNVYGSRLLSDIAITAFIQPEKSLDLLQGLQLLLSWYNFNMNSFQITNLIFLARSICVSLGTGEGPSLSPLQPLGSMTSDPLAPESLEKMRAFAGTYYLVTSAFTTNKKPDELMNTSYLDFCCRTLERRMEYPTDELVVNLVKVQQLSQSISLSLALRNDSNFSRSIEYQLPPLDDVVRSFQQQLQVFEQMLPETVKTQQVFMGHFRVAQILLFEVGLNEKAASELMQVSRTELLWCCLTACREFMALRFAHQDTEEVQVEGEPPSDCKPRMTSLAAADFVYTFMTIVKLLMLQAPGWDLDAARSEIDLEGIMDRQMRQIDAIIAFRRRTGDGVPLTSSVTRYCRQPKQPLTSSIEASAASIPPKEDPFEMLRYRLKELKEILAREAPGIFPQRPASSTSPENLSVLLGFGNDMAVPDTIMTDMNMESWAYLLTADDGLPPAGLKDPPSYGFVTAATSRPPVEAPPPYSTTAESPPPLEKGGEMAAAAEKTPASATTNDDSPILHFLDHEHDSVSSLSLRYNVPAAALRRANRLGSDHLLLGRRVVLIPVAAATTTTSLSPHPVEGEDEERRKSRIRRWMVACKEADYDVAVLYLEQNDYDVEAAVEAYFADEAWERAHPVAGRSSKRGTGGWNRLSTPASASSSSATPARSSSAWPLSSFGLGSWR